MATVEIRLVHRLQEHSNSRFWNHRCRCIRALVQHFPLVACIPDPQHNPHRNRNLPRKYDGDMRVTGNFYFETRHARAKWQYTEKVLAEAEPEHSIEEFRKDVWVEITARKMFLDQLQDFAACEPDCDDKAGVQRNAELRLARLRRVLQLDHIAASQVIRIYKVVEYHRKKFKYATRDSK